MRIGDRIAFRQSETWQKFRQEVAERQGNNDYVTGLPLTEDWNCHHLCVDQEKYNELNFDNFIAVNHDIHELIHKKWNVGDTATSNENLKKVFDKMDALNGNNITRVLFKNHIEYGFDESDKRFTTAAVIRLNIPNNHGWLYWNKNTYGCPETYPEDSVKWIIWLRQINNYSSADTLLALELRHLCLWSSLKNLQRPDVQAKNSHWKEHQELLLKELPKTTSLINRYREFLNK